MSATFSRIDFLMVSQEIVRNVTQSLIHPVVISDHSPIQTDFNLQSTPLRSENWKVGNSVFDHPQIKKQISEYIHTFMDINKNCIPDIPLI